MQPRKRLSWIKLSGKTVGSPMHAATPIIRAITERPTLVHLLTLFPSATRLSVRLSQGTFTLCPCKMYSIMYLIQALRTGSYRIITCGKCFGTMKFHIQGLITIYGSAPLTLPPRPSCSSCMVAVVACYTTMWTSTTRCVPLLQSTSQKYHSLLSLKR